MVCIRIRNIRHKTGLIPVGKRFLYSSAHWCKGESLSHTIYNPPENNPTAEPFLITHGLLGSKQNWNSIAKAVAKVANRKVIIFDARNHGDSPQVPEHSYDLMAEDVLELANSLNIRRFSFMGHSMGGRTAMVLALRNPQSVTKLVVVDVSPITINTSFHSEMKGYLQTLMDINFNNGKKIVLSEARKVANEALLPTVPQASIRAFLLTNLAEVDGNIVWKPNLPVLKKAIENIGAFPEDVLSRKFDSPSLFIRGEKSTYIPDDDIPGIKKLFPSAIFETISKAGHWPHADNIKDFLVCLNLFLKS